MLLLMGLLLMASPLTSLASGVQQRDDAIEAERGQDCEASSDLSLLQSLPPKSRIASELRSGALIGDDARRDGDGVGDDTSQQSRGQQGFEDDLETVTMSHFPVNYFLNRRYVEDRGNDIAGHKTYWSTKRGRLIGRYFLYFCKAQGRWMIAYEGGVHLARGGECRCPFWARGPEGASLYDTASRSHWDEWDAGKVEVSQPSHAGVEFISTVSKIERIHKDVHHDFGGGEETGLDVRKDVNPDFGSRGVVRGVKRHSRADKLGIRFGWRILRVDGEKFTMDRYRAALRSGENFTLSFAVGFNAYRADTVEGGQCGEHFRAQSVRHQGSECYNCWAYAVTVAAEWRLCKKSNGKWRGGAAYLSVGYLTSCAASASLGENGCRGGNMLEALKWLGRHGAPTGGTGDNHHTCVPNFANGALLAESRRHATMVGGQKFLVPPECPTSCTNEDYPRSLSEDVFRPEGFAESWQTTAFESATRALLLRGPILMNFPVFKSFLDYTGGIFTRPEEDELLHYHVVLAVGYGPDFIIAVNSWGHAWGEDGYFKISHELVESYVIPGDIQGHGEGYPYPLPDVPVVLSVWMDGFDLSDLNNKFTGYQTKKVNGKATLWNAMNTYLVYYCKGRDVWAITTADRFESLEHDGSVCYWLALQRQSSCQGHVSLTREDCKWSQWDYKAGELAKCDTCGVKMVTEE